MWLALEKSGVRHQRRDLGVEHLTDPQPGPGRRALVLTAAHTVLPEAAVEDLPDLAREEVAQGLRGPLRGAIARAGSGPEVEGLRDDLLGTLGAGRIGRSAALVVADQVHLRRLVRGDVPAVLAVGALGWYDAYRVDGDPYLDAVRALRGLRQEWRLRPEARPDLEAEMRRVAASEVGDDPEDLLDVPV